MSWVIDKTEAGTFLYEQMNTSGRRLKLDRQGLCKPWKSSWTLIKIKLLGSSRREGILTLVEHPLWTHTASSGIQREQVWKRIMADCFVRDMLKINMMDGRPSQMKNYRDYQGSPIPPCGDYQPKQASKVPPPTLAPTRRINVVSIF